MQISESRWDELESYRDSLEHHGVLGMKWGVRNKRKTSGTRRKKSYSIEAQAKRTKRARKRIERAKARAEKREAEAKRRAQKVADKKEAQRKKILSNPKSLYKHRNEFSYEEIQQAMQRFDWEKKLNGYSRDQLNNGAEFIATLFKYADNSISLYNAAARITNSLSDKDVMPYIKSIKNNDKNKDKKK